MKFVAFLRGINVGGHSIIKMDELRELVSALGFKEVSTYKQSGNIIFETNKRPEASAALIRRALNKELKKEIEVFVYDNKYFGDIIALDPFKRIRLDPSHMFVTFFAEDIPSGAKMPKGSPKGEVEIILAKKNAIFWIADLSKGEYNGGFVEKIAKMPSTTRNWRSITEIAALLS